MWVGKKPHSSSVNQGDTRHTRLRAHPKPPMSRLLKETFEQCLSIRSHLLW